jgi:predicted nucleic-acid-binding Zn-ribbon protein
MNIESVIQDKYKCVKCNGTSCLIKEVAMTGTGLSKMFDIQHNHFLFVSCENCGYVEVYNPRILEGKSRGQLGTIMDVLFG